MSPIQRRGITPRLGLIAVLLAVFTVVPAPGVATADPSPSPSTSAPATPGAGPNLGQKPKNGSDSLLEPFNVTDKYGIPISSYTVKTDAGGWKDIDLKIWNIVAQLLFGLAKWGVGFTCWLLDWALDFGLAQIMIGPVEDISSTIKNQVIDRLGLPGLFLLFAGFYCGWLILFKERSRGFAEIGVSLVVAAVTTTVLVSPAQVLLGQHDQAQPQGSTMLLSEEGLLGKAKGFALEVASIVLADDPASATGSADPDNVSKPITNALVEAFIVKPNQLMVYGQTFDGQCDKAFREFKIAEFKLDQAGLNYWSAMVMDSIYDTNFIGQLTKNAKKFEAACGEVKPKAKRASADLAFSAVFAAIAAIIVAVLMILVTGTFLTAQGWLAFEAIRGHWALTAGILPGGGRAVLWRWISAITKAVLSIIIAILFKAIFILLVLALLDAETGDVLAVKFIVIDVTAIAALAGHKRIKQTAQTIAVNLNRKLANARVGGAGRRSVFSSPGRYAETAPGLKQMWGEARGEARRVSRPVGQGLKSARKAWVGSPQANRKKASRLRTAARLATNAATAVGTGGTSAAAKVAVQQAAKRTLKNRLAMAATAKMSQTRGGRATLATGKGSGRHCQVRRQGVEARLHGHGRRTGGDPPQRCCDQTWRRCGSRAGQEGRRRPQGRQGAHCRQEGSGGQGLQGRVRAQPRHSWPVRCTARNKSTGQPRSGADSAEAKGRQHSRAACWRHRTEDSGRRAAGDRIRDTGQASAQGPRAEDTEFGEAPGHRADRSADDAHSAHPCAADDADPSKEVGAAEAAPGPATGHPACWPAQAPAVAEVRPGPTGPGRSAQYTRTTSQGTPMPTSDAARARAAQRSTIVLFAASAVLAVVGAALLLGLGRAERPATPGPAPRATTSSAAAAGGGTQSARPSAGPASLPPMRTWPGAQPAESPAVHQGPKPVPAPVAEAARAFVTAWASHDARPGRDSSLDDASRRAADYAAGDLAEDLLTHTSGSAGTQEWLGWKDRQVRVTVTVLRVSLPDGAPTPSEDSSFARVIYKLKESPARGSATESEEQVALKLRRGADGSWRVVGLPNV
ncbi:hypothetical protein SSCG_05593 [Streptomyces clavuligerus]|nr:hypothetical protein [Streptomyces clavuligerus]EDY52565.1 hypothetical protein SSCG_05593 [Streptomyces clavuligerus]